jgi:ubiquinone/menaquinone biosynthesis C-methylase UbiE
MSAAMAAVAAAPAVPLAAAIKERQRSTWSSGSNAVVGTTLQIVGEALCEALDLRAGSRVLDVAAGNGSATLAAARRGCEVVSTDIVPSLPEAGGARARAEGHAIRFQEADAERLPFADASFDAVMSTFGVMFVPDQERAASELARVCKPGGRIGLASWTPESFIGQLFRTLASYAPPRPGLRSPALWGSRARVDELFAHTARQIRMARRTFAFRYRSLAHWIEVFRAYYGPINRTFAALDAGRRDALTCDVLALLARGNRFGDSTLVLPSEYLEVVIDRR